MRHTLTSTVCPRITSRVLVTGLGALAKNQIPYRPCDNDHPAAAHYRIPVHHHLCLPACLPACLALLRCVPRRGGPLARFGHHASTLYRRGMSSLQSSDQVAGTGGAFQPLGNTMGSRESLPRHLLSSTGHLLSLVTPLFIHPVISAGPTSSSRRDRRRTAMHQTYTRRPRNGRRTSFSSLSLSCRCLCLVGHLVSFFFSSSFSFSFFSPPCCFLPCAPRTTENPGMLFWAHTHTVGGLG
ncbi:hypothetical protein IWX90DRAFT_232928 [Phyllosticta citrichinensis]|uniref:Uncharacterized protein n=1 Tax=Phyllosticta citrichinensis TaxID=1130410 RepID=A0ABR1XUV1_9PEZI